MAVKMRAAIKAMRDDWLIVDDGKMKREVSVHTAEVCARGELYKEPENPALACARRKRRDLCKADAAAAK